MNLDALRKMAAMGLTLEQAIEIMEAVTPVRSSGAVRQARYRERQNRNVTSDVTDNATERDNPSPSPSLEGSPKPPPITLTLSPSEKVTTRRVPPGDFELFWSNYPRKTAKAEARKAYASALGRISGPDPPAVLLAAVALQSGQWTEPRFIPHASTWLNKDRWEDEISRRPEPEKATNVHRFDKSAAYLESLSAVDAAMAEAVRQRTRRVGGG